MFTMKKLNQRVKMNILAPFYIKNVDEKNYFTNHFVSVTIYVT